MPLPDNVTLVTVTGTYMDLGGNPKVGKVLFSADGTLVDPGAKVIITSGTVEAELHNGTFSIELPATDDPDVTPSGFTYKVTEQFQDGGGRPPYNLSLPSSLTEPVDVSSLDMGVPPGTPLTNYVTLESLNAEAGFRASGDQAILDSKGQPNGIAPLDAGQKVPVLYLPDQSGNYVAVAQKGAANGVATLNGASQIPASQYDGAVVVLVAQKAAANGVATLDGSSLVPQAQIPTSRVGGSGAVLFGAQVTGDTNQRLQLNSLGTLLFGSGAAAPDTQLLRIGAALMRVVGGLESQGAGTANTGFAVNVLNDAFDRLRIYNSGIVEWGPGNIARDVNLYRGGANLLKTDDTFDAANFPSGAWNTWVPTWATSSGSATPSFGNATLNCSYTKHGRTVMAIFDVAFGSTTNFGASPTASDNWRFGFPVPAASTGMVAGWIELAGTPSVQRMMARIKPTTTTAFEIEFNSARQDAVSVTAGIADSVSPWTWASGMAVRGSLLYESAS